MPPHSPNDMSRLSALLQGVRARLNPPVWPDLDERAYAEEGCWIHEDKKTGHLWGYAAVSLDIAWSGVQRDPDVLWWLLRQCSELPIASLHVGLLSQRLPAQVVEAWERKGLGQGPLDKNLKASRRQRAQRLKSTQLRQRLGYVLVRVDLQAVSPLMQSATLMSLVWAISQAARSINIASRPLTREEIGRVEARTRDQEVDPRCADYVLHPLAAAPEWPSLVSALCAIDDGVGVADYHVVLDMARTKRELRYSCALRVWHQSSEATLAMLRALWDARLTPRNQLTRKYLHWPQESEVRDWPSAGHGEHVSLAPFVFQSGGMAPAVGGVPLRSVSGELRTFAPWRDLSGTGGTLVLGRDAAARKAFLTDLVITHLQEGGCASVATADPTFVSTVAKLGGQVVRVAEDGTGGLDPFRWAQDYRNACHFDLSQWVAELAGMGTHPWARHVVEEALSQAAAWAQATAEPLSLEWVFHALQAQSATNLVAEELVQHLVPYVAENGEYARLFGGESVEIADNATLTVFDLSAFVGHAQLPHLAHAVLAIEGLRRLNETNRSNARLVVTDASCPVDFGQGFGRWLRCLRALGLVAIAECPDLQDISTLSMLEFNNYCAYKVFVSLTDEDAKKVAGYYGFASELDWQREHVGAPSGNQVILVGEEVGVFQWLCDPQSSERPAGKRLTSS